MAFTRLGSHCCKKFTFLLHGSIEFIDNVVAFIPAEVDAKFMRGSRSKDDGNVGKWLVSRREDLLVRR